MPTLLSGRDKIRTSNSLIKIFIVFGAFAIILGFASFAKTQTYQATDRQTPAPTVNTQTQTSVDNWLAQISKKFEVLRATEEANLDARQRALGAAQERRVNATRASAVAEALFNQKSQSVDFEQTRIKQLQVTSPTGEQMAAATKALKKAEGERDAAQLAVSEAKANLEVNENEIMMAQVEIIRASDQLRTNSQIRSIQTQTLKVLNDKWRANPTELNLVALTDEITSISCAASIYANPLWKTSPNPGAFIFYQTVGERNRNETPHRITDLSNSNQKVCQGRYYVWSERIVNGQQKPTSDKNATPLDIGVDTTVVPVVENP